MKQNGDKQRSSGGPTPGNLPLLSGPLHVASPPQFTPFVHAPSKSFLTALAVLLTLLHAILSVTASAEKSMTSDEIAHLVAGHVYNSHSDFRLQPENGNLPQRLAALPMTIAAVPLPPVRVASWGLADVWNYGREFFYRQGISAGEWLFLGRAMISLVGAATAMLVFVWSRALFGWRGGFLSLILFVFSPTFLAHSALTTSDVVMTFFFLASVGAWWRHLQRPGFTWATISALTLGLAFVAKFSAVLLPPMLALIGLGWSMGEIKESGWKTIFLRLARTTLVHALVAWGVIWIFYGVRFSAFSPDLGHNADFNHGWGWTLTGLGMPARIIWWLKEWRVLPEAWLYGLAFVLNFARARGAFMSGDYSVTGWVMFFPFAFLKKTTLPFLGLLAGEAIAAIIVAKRGIVAFRCLRPLLPLAVLFVIYWATSLASNLNIGHRHILPTYPVLFIVAGWLGQWIDLRRPILSACIIGAALWHIGESLRIRPDYLAYFNQTIGGPQHGWKHLVDSSLDWGQELPGLKQWADENLRDDRLFLSYFGTGDPRYEGIDATALPTLPEVGPPRRWHVLAPGIYAISATMLQHVYSSIRGPWTVDFEREYQKLRLLESTLIDFQDIPKRRAILLQDAPAENWTVTWKRYEQLRFARLCHYLRVRSADAVIGYSIFVFRLDESELNRAVGGSLADWSGLIEQVIEQRHSALRGD